MKVLFTLLTSPSFWSKIGFFVSYITTCLLVLEVLRLVHSDARKRDVEKMLDFYTRSRTRGTSVDAHRPRKAEQIQIPVSLAELERDLHRPPVPLRTRSPTATHVHSPSPSHSYPDLDRDFTLNNAVHERSTHMLPATQHAAAVSVRHPVHPQPSQSPPRRLRKHSDSFHSIGSAESKGSSSSSSSRRKRDSSPASTASSSKSSSRHTSPTPRSKQGRKGASGFGRLLKTRRE